MYRQLVVPVLCALALAAGNASAQSPDWYASGRLSWVDSSATSGELGDTSSKLVLDSGLGVEINATLLTSERFAVEFSAGASVSTTGGGAGVADASNALSGTTVRCWQCGHCVSSPRPTIRSTTSRPQLGQGNRSAI